MQQTLTVVFSTFSTRSSRRHRRRQHILYLFQHLFVALKNKNKITIKLEMYDIELNKQINRKKTCSKQNDFFNILFSKFPILFV